MSATVERARPPMWQVERTAGGDVMHFGRHRFPLSDVTAVSGEEVRDRYSDGIVMGAMLFFAVACALAFGVFDGGLSSRFLLGTVFLAFLGAAGFSELGRLNRQSYYEVNVSLQSGERLVFTSADRADVEALMRRLGA